MSGFYITPAELSALGPPLGINWSSLFPGTGEPGGAEQQLCLAVSNTIDKIVRAGVYGAADKPYVLRAAPTTETATTAERIRALIDFDGNLIFRATYQPVLSVTAASFIPVLGGGSDTPTALNLDSMWIEGRDIAWIGTFAQFQHSPLRVSVTYLNGYANGLLTAPVTAGQSTVTVDDATGFVAGQAVWLYDVPAEELQVASVAGNVVTLSAPLANDHAAGLRLSALEPVVQVAALYLVKDLLAVRAQSGLAAARNTPGTTQTPQKSQPAQLTDWYAKAKELLSDYILTP